MNVGNFKLTRKHSLVALGVFLIALILALGVFGFDKYQALAKLSLEHQTVLEELALVKEEKEKIFKNLEEEQAARESIEEDLRSFGKTLGTLEKLSKTDEELLQKYSKIYFLNENYIPSKLDLIDREFTYPPDTVLEIHGDVRPYLEDLLEEAREDGIDLLVASAYRSFSKQASLKYGYRVLYGSGANQFSADQGYSEHQLGTTVDFTTSTIGGAFNSFEPTAAYKWLVDNAHRFGFVLSYPKGNAYYQFEPWHWRFVGEDLAGDLKSDGKYFYDLDQREIDEYLVKIFD